MKLSELLRNMRDQFRGHEIVDGQVVISGEALSGIVETLNHAVEAARALENQQVNVQARHAGRVIPLPRRHHRRARHQSPWRHSAAASTPRWEADNDDDGGAA